MLGVFPNGAPDSVNKGTGLTQALAKQGFESLLGAKNASLIFYLLPELLQAK